MQEKDLKKKERDSNLELLRIIAILLIIINHVFNESICFPEQSEFMFNFVIIRSIYGLFGMIGNCLFIFITGFFLDESHFTWKKFFLVWFQIFFTSAFIGVIYYLFKIPTISWSNFDAFKQFGYEAAKSISKKDLVHAFLPNYNADLWYASTYLLFYLFTPFLSITIKSINQKTHLSLCFILLLIDSVVRYIPGQSFIPKDSLLHFLSLSFLISYIKLYKPIFFTYKKRNLKLFIISFFCLLLIVSCSYMFERLNYIDTKIADSIANKLTRVFSLPVVFASLFLFLFFTESKIQYNKTINFLASTTFGVYLFHENILINRSIYHFLFKTDDFISSKLLIPYLLLIVLCIYFIGVTYDYIRKKLFDRFFLFLFEKLNRLTHNKT